MLEFKRLFIFLCLLTLPGLAARAENLPRVQWNFVSTTANTLGYVYTPFFIEGSHMTLYTGGPGVQPRNGVRRLETDLPTLKAPSENIIIPSGPNLAHYDYFRAPRVAGSGNELWMLIEVAGCYSGCDSPQNPGRLAVYRSQDKGQSWKFLDFVQVDGQTYIAKWFGHTGLVFNPNGSTELNLQDLTKNRFITIGENRDIFVSADGIHYKSIAMIHPFAKDRLVFASIARTPFGFHLMTCSNWSDRYYTTTVRHLFSKDLIHWLAIESNSYLKNPDFYKGVHLSYDEKTNRLWALSTCGQACGFLAWLEPQDFSQPQPAGLITDEVPIGEFVHIQGQTALVINKFQKDNGWTYKVRFANGTYDSGYTKEMFAFPLAFYQREGCDSKLCVGDAVSVSGSLATILGIHQVDVSHTKYAVKFSTGVVDTGYTFDMLGAP